MSARGKQALIWLIAIGTGARVALAFGFYGYEYDVDSVFIVREAIDASGLDFYGIVNAVPPVLRWPYPPGFLPAIFGADWVAAISPLPVHGLIQLPAIAADAALAWIAQAYLARRGASEGMRLGAAGLIALGPVFILISGYHGQIDSLAILPAVAAIVVWERGGSRRALSAGALLGVGAALKVVPGFALLALLPHVRSAREGLTLVGSAVAVPAALLLPFAIADPDGVATLADYRGAPGQGGLTLAMQPGLAAFSIQDGAFALNEPVELLYDNGIFNVLLLAVVGAGLWYLRPPPALGAAIVYLSLWSFASGFFFHYLIWGLPFLIMSGRLWLAGVVQALVLIPALLFYLGPWTSDAVLVIYVVLMLALWAVSLAALASAVRGLSVPARTAGA